MSEFTNHLARKIGTVEFETKLSQVAAQQFPKSKERLVEHILCEGQGDLLIVDYNGSDEFDINPLLQGTFNSTKTAIWSQYKALIATD